MDDLAKFDIFFTHIEFDEGSSGKEQPVAIIEIFHEADVVFEYPIYSYRKWFDLDENIGRYYEIKDINDAGLLRRSFIDARRIEAISIEQIKRSKKLGHLSDRDIADFLDFIRKYELLKED